MGMKNKMILIAFIGSNIFAGQDCKVVAQSDQRHALECLMRRSNEQTIIIMSAMAGLGIHALLKNMTNMCAADGSDCLKMSLPIMAIPYVSYMVYKAFKRKKV